MTSETKFSIESKALPGEFCVCSFECYVLAINSVNVNLPKNDDLSLCSLGEDFF